MGCCFQALGDGDASPSAVHILVTALRIRVKPKAQPGKNIVIRPASFAGPFLPAKRLYYPERYQQTEALMVKAPVFFRGPSNVAMFQTVKPKCFEAVTGSNPCRARRQIFIIFIYFTTAAA
jgi:hypothetical protein